MHQPTSELDAHQSQREESRALYFSLVLGFTLLVVKFAAYFLTHSAAIFTDAMEGIVNVLASAFAVYSIALAHRPADAEHPYGHGKIEFFSAGFEGAMILVVALLSVGKAVLTMVEHEPPKPQGLDVAVGLMALAMLANGGAGFYLWHVGRKKRSIIVEADGLHLMSDALTSVMVIIALVIIRLTRWQLVDPLAAIVVSFYVGFLGWHLVARSVSGLMDKQDVHHDVLLKKILDSHLGINGKPPRICSYHKLWHRHSGRYTWVDFHISISPWLDIEAGHRIASSLEYEMELALHEGDATAHIEPCKNADCLLCAAMKASGDGPHPAIAQGGRAAPDAGDSAAASGA